MDENTLYEAVKLKEEIDDMYRLKNNAYNGHIYLQVSLNGVDINVCKDEIAKILYNHFVLKVKALQKEMDEL